MARSLDRLNATNSSGVAFQRLWQRNCEAVEANVTDLQDQIDTVNAILDDDVLTPDKKPVWIFMHSFLTGEQAGLDTQATNYGITTEKTNYDTAITDLNTYLATLTTAVDWDDLSGNTTIVGVDFRGYFNDVMTTKQALINKIAAEAKVLADAAQTAADDAATDAATAQTTANTVKLNDSITASYPAPGEVLTAADVGSDCTITIAAHDRVYVPGISSLSVAGGTVTGLAFSTTYYVYYDDATQADTTPTYAATTNANHALPNKATGRHFVGKITTPADGGGGTSGGSAPPSGGGEIEKPDIGSTL